MKYSPKDMKDTLDRSKVSIKKKFGQNFIVDENIIDSIIKKSAIDKNTLVVEIGPGMGSLTYKLAMSAKEVLCYEIDTDLKEILYTNFKDYQNVHIIYQDFLKVNLLQELKNFSYEKLYVIANLPYYITTPIIIKIIEDMIPVDKMVLMVQKEVGDRFKATCGSKDYGSLSVFLNYYFDIKKLLDVSRNVFLPKPNVDSVVIEFKRKEELLPVVDKDLFFKLIRDSFMQKRKTLRNNLKNYDLDIIEKELNKFGFNLQVRAEQLSLEIYVNLANSLAIYQK